MHCPGYLLTSAARGLSEWSSVLPAPASGFLPQSKDINEMRSCDNKLAVGVNVCLSLC